MLSENFITNLNDSIMPITEYNYLTSRKMRIATTGVQEELIKESWGATLEKKVPQECYVVLKIMIPVTAAIGRLVIRFNSICLFVSIKIFCVT